jgi:hypothetical protein
MSMKNSNDAIGNQTRELLACSTVPQPTAPPRAPMLTAACRNFVNAPKKSTDLKTLSGYKHRNCNLMAERMINFLGPLSPGQTKT